MRTIASLATVLFLCLVNAAPAAAASWKYHGRDGLEVQAGNGTAQAGGNVLWYHGSFPYGYRHRGDYAAGSNVHATRAVGCIWAKVSYGYPTGSFTVGPGGPSGGISGGSYDGNGLYVNCRKPGQTRPTQLSLYGIGYAKALLNSTTLQVCISKTKQQGPRFCAWEKNTY